MTTCHKQGYEVLEYDLCKWCGYSFEFSTDLDPTDVDPYNTFKRGEGQPSHPKNTIRTQAAVKADVTNTETKEMLGEAGVVYPSNSGCDFMQKKQKMM